MRTIDVTPVHNELLKVNTKYKNAILTSIVERAEELPEELNHQIDTQLLESGRSFELYTTELLYSAYSNPNSNQIVEGIENSDIDFSYLIITDEGVHIVGNRMALSFTWADIKYCIVDGEDYCTVELHSGMLIYLGATNINSIVAEILSSYNKNYPETFKILQEIKPSE